MEGKIFYLTKEKLKELQKQQAELIAFERQKTIGVEAPKMVESEDINPEFVSYHEDMDALRARIDELDNILNHYELIKAPAKDKQGQVGIGATVAVHADDQSHQFTIVGTLEANPEAGKISNESPVGKALLGRRVGDEVVAGNSKYRIKDISYQIS